MSKQHHLKRTLETLDLLTFERGRIVVVLDRGVGGNKPRVSVRVDGVEKAQLQQGHRAEVDRGRLVIEVERMLVRQARLYLRVAADLRIDRIDDPVPADASSMQAVFL